MMPNGNAQQQVNAPTPTASGGDAASINLPQLFKGIPLLGDMETQFVSYLILYSWIVIYTN